LFECSTKYCGQYKNAILVDVIANGVFSGIVQGCDNYTTFFRYAAVVGEKRITKTRKILTLIYVIVTLYLCWWPYYIIIPFFTNMNGPEQLAAYASSQYYWNFPAYICYNAVRSQDPLSTPLTSDSCSVFPLVVSLFTFASSLCGPALVLPLCDWLSVQPSISIFSLFAPIRVVV
jgi:hypothetical protein